MWNCLGGVLWGVFRSVSEQSFDGVLLFRCVLAVHRSCFDGAAVTCAAAPRETSSSGPKGFP